MYHKFEENLLETFSHDGIDSSERKGLLELAEQVEIDLEDYKRLRSKVFDLAKSQGLHGFDWLEDAMKILDKAKEITYSSKAFFSPENSGQEDLEQLLLSAHKAIWVCVFTISDDELAKALIQKHKQGLDVKIITDNDKIYDRGSDIIEMKDAGIPVKIDDTRHHMHHKFAIVDKEILVNGSYNWTRSADEYNHENLIITKDEALVKDFTQEFKKLWNEFDSLK
jgi:phosphatidylserine/phosphatidylglycerophosphate/cardiolipin synthase-like enzyme